MSIEDDKYYVALGMRELGGNFVKKLGEALVRADPTNTKKIKETFSDYWDEYNYKGRNIHKAQQEKWRKRST